MADFALLSTAASGMDAQRAALDVAAKNIAAAEATGPHGRFARETPVFALMRDDAGAPQVAFAGTRLEKNAEGDTVAEMIGVLNASRAFEANAAVFEAGKQLALRTIEMGRV